MMPTPAMAPLLAASFPVQLHVVTAVLALLIGVTRLVWPYPEARSAALDWSFLGLLSATALSGFLLPTPAGSPSLLGVSTHHVLAITALLGSAAAVVAARAGDRLGRRRIATATFGGVLLMAGLFEVLPGRLLNTVLAGG
jgi:uncharacterized membrane protein